MLATYDSLVFLVMMNERQEHFLVPFSQMRFENKRDGRDIVDEDEEA